MISNWYFTDESIIDKRLRNWLKNEYPSSSVSDKSIRSYNCKTRKGTRLFYLSPDIDVAMIKDDKLFGYEVKRISGRKSSQTDVILKKLNSVWDEGEKLREEQVEELRRENRTVSEIDKNLYSGIGEALFLLRYVNFSYLVYPKLEELPNYNLEIRLFLDELFKSFLPIGLIEYCPNLECTDFNFKITHEAKEYRYGANCLYIIGYLNKYGKIIK